LAFSVCTTYSGVVSLLALVFGFASTFKRGNGAVYSGSWSCRAYVCGMLNTTAAAAAESSGTYCCTRVGSAFAVSTGLGSSWGGGSEPLLWWLRLVLTRVLKKPRPELEEWELEAASNSSSKGVASICDEG